MTGSDSAHFSHALKTAILLPVAVIFLTAGLLFGMIFSLLKVVKLSDQSYEAISQARYCEKSMGDMESGVRGYLLNDKPEFLEPYTQAVSHIDRDFDKLRDLERGTPPTQVAEVDDLIRAKNLWLEHARGQIALRRQQVMPTPEDNTLAKNLMANVRVQFQTHAGNEEQLHHDRQGSVRRMKQLLGWAGGTLLLFLSATVGQMVWRQFTNLGGKYQVAIAALEQRHAELLRSEADLEQQKEWFRVTLTSIGDGVIVTDKEGRVVFLNGEAERLTGWNSGEALLQPLAAVFHIIHEGTHLPSENPVLKVLQEKKVVGMTKNAVLVSRSGTEWPIGDSAAPIKDTKGEMIGVVVVFHNATDVRQAQKALRMHSEELETRVSERTMTLQQTVSELESFSYTVSHDLRSPLRAMQGFAQAVLEDYGDKLDDPGRNYLDRICKAAERLDLLIQDLLSYTRISPQDAPLVDLDLDSIVRGIIEHYPNLHEPAAEVRVEGALPHIWGQEAALTQVLANLLGNATKFVLPGTVPKVQIWGESLGEDRFRLWIEDNGIGIAPKDSDRIFQMFVRVNESQLYSGTGVGLAIVKKAVQAMHGTLGVEPGEKGGSRFWVEFKKVK